MHRVYIMYTRKGYVLVKGGLYFNACMVRFTCCKLAMRRHTVTFPSSPSTGVEISIIIYHTGQKVYIVMLTTASWRHMNNCITRATYEQSLTPVYLRFATIVLALCHGADEYPTIDIGCREDDSILLLQYTRGGHDMG